MAQSTVAIGDDDCLYRRLVPDHFYPDGSVNSNAYKFNGRPDPSISVDLARLSTPEQSIARGRRSDTMIGTLSVREVRALGFTVQHQPTDENPAHSIIEGNTTRLTSKKLAEITRVHLL